MASMHQYDHMMSDSDDESFVVLGSSIPPESLLEVQQSDCQPPEEVDRSVIQASLQSAREAINELSKSEVSNKSSIVEMFPSLPKVESLPNGQLIQPDTTSPSSIMSNMSELTPSEVQARVDGLIEENNKLKEALVQNNLALKKQYATIAMWNEDVQKVHEMHKQKFAETKAYIEKLKLENRELKDSLQVAENSVSCLREELDNMASPDSHIKELNENLYKSAFDNLSKFELEGAQAKITLLSEQLEAKEKAELEVKTEVAKLQAQVEQLNLNKQTAEIERQFSQQLSLKEDSLKEEIEKLKVEKEQLNRQLNDDHKSSIMKQSKLIEEIDELRATLAEKSAAETEVVDRVQEQLMLAQIQITELQEKAKKDKEAMQKLEKDNEDYKRGLQGLQARVVDPAVISQMDNKIQELEKKLRESQSELEVMPVLQEQLDVYKTDFEAEREAKNSLKSQKDSAVEDLGHLQRRNQQLLEEIEVLRAVTGNNPEISRSASSAPEATAPAATTPPSLRYSCPLCMKSCRSLRLLEEHIEDCLLTTEAQ